MKVLCVDDEERILFLLETLLKREGYKVITAQSGAEGIEKAKAEKPDSIILDISMPEMNGFEVCEILKNDESTREIPILFLTAYYIDQTSIIKGLDLGANDYLTKPFKTGELLARLRVLIRLKKTIEAYWTKIEEFQRHIKRKSELLSKLTHELRTPLSCINLTIPILSNNDESITPEIKKEFVNTIVASCQRMNQLIDDTIELDRFEAGEMKAHIIEFPLSKEMDYLHSLFKANLAEKGLNFSIEIEPMVPKYISTDPNMLGQVLINLISNAIKYSEKGKIRVHIAPAEGEDKILFSVSDEGFGIPQADKEKVFEKYKRVEDNPLPKSSSGLGLYIAKIIVEKLGGKIWVESEQGKGSTFFFTVVVDYSKGY